MAALTAAFYTVPQWSTFTWAAIGLSGAAAVLLGIRLHRPSRRLPWLLLAGVLISFTAGDTTYNIQSAQGLARCNAVRAAGCAGPTVAGGGGSSVRSCDRSTKNSSAGTQFMVLVRLRGTDKSFNWRYAVASSAKAKPRRRADTIHRGLYRAVYEKSPDTRRSSDSVPRVGTDIQCHLLPRDAVVFTWRGCGWLSAWI
jgi:hypothetical protein